MVDRVNVIIKQLVVLSRLSPGIRKTDFAKRAQAHFPSSAAQRIAKDPSLRSVAGDLQVEAGAVGVHAGRLDVQEFTISFWQDIYKGDLGRARVGVQYEYVTLDLFSGASVIPAGNGLTAAQATAGANSGLHPNNNIVFFLLRYYPFN